MAGTKLIWLSKTFWGAVVMLVSTVLMVFGVVDINPEEQAVMLDKIIGFLTIGADLVGFILVIVGRITATKKIE